MRKVLGLAVGAAVMAAGPVQAGCDLDDYVGYTIVAKKTVQGWLDKGQKKADDGFEGCEYGRIIIFTDNTAVVCQTYSYSYSYMPDAYLATDGFSWKMCIDGDDYNIRPY